MTKATGKTVRQLAEESAATLLKQQCGFYIAELCFADYVRSRERPCNNQRSVYLQHAGLPGARREMGENVR